MLRNDSLGKKAISQTLAHKSVSGQLHVVVRRLLETDWIAQTMPDKPTSRLQKYRLTDKARVWLNQNQSDSKQ